MVRVPARQPLAKIGSIRRKLRVYGNQQRGRNEHIDFAEDFLRRSKEYLGADDLHQASEKGWGGAAHIKAVAAKRAANTRVTTNLRMW